MVTPLGHDPIEFVAVRGGKIHVLPPREAEQAAILVRFGDISDDLALSLVLGAMLTRCGRTVYQHSGGLQQSAWPVGSFSDDLLCGRCYRTVPEDERSKLFEHAEAASA